MAQSCHGNTAPAAAAAPAAAGVQPAAAGAQPAAPEFRTPKFGGTFTDEGFELRASTMRRLLGQRYTPCLKGLTVRERLPPGTPRQAMHNVRTHRCYKLDTARDRLVLPRRFGWVLENALGGSATQPPGTFAGAPHAVRPLTAEACEPALHLYEYQQVYVDSVVDTHLSAERQQQGRAQLYVHAPTGSGKTFMLAGMVAKLAVPALVVVPTRALQAQTIAAVRTVLPGLNCLAYSNKLERQLVKKGHAAPSGDTHDLVVCVINTARQKPPAFYRTYGVVFFDEAHEMCSPSSSQLLWTAQAPCVVGLSATPSGRASGLDVIVTKFLGPPVSIESVVPPELLDDATFVGHVREVWYEGDPRRVANVVNAAGATSAVQTVGAIVSDPARLELVAAETERLLRMHETLPPDQLEYWGLGPDPESGDMRRHSVFVFAEHREYLPRLREAILRRIPPEMLIYDDPGVPGAAAPVVLRGGATATELDDATHGRVVLTTYGFSRRGISYKHMTALIEASPRRNGFTQILGRVCRVASKRSLLTIRRCVVDIRDMATSLASQSSTRRIAYREKEWPIFHIRCGYEDFPEGAAAKEGEEPVKTRTVRTVTTDLEGNEAVDVTLEDDEGGLNALQSDVRYLLGVLDPEPAAASAAEPAAASAAAAEPAAAPAAAAEPAAAAAAEPATEPAAAEQ